MQLAEPVCIMPELGGSHRWGCIHCSSAFDSVAEVVTGCVLHGCLPAVLMNQAVSCVLVHIAMLPAQHIDALGCMPEHASAAQLSFEETKMLHSAEEAAYHG